MSVIYLDNNATTSVAPEVFESMIPFFTEKYGNASSMHTFGGQVGKSIQDAREKVAAMLGAQPEEIVFTSCGTESDSTAVMSALQAQPEKKHVITTRVEHSALIALGQHLEQKGYVDTESLRHYPSILFGLEMAMRHYEQGGWRHYDTPFSRGQAGIPINGLIWMGDYKYMLEQVEEKMKEGFRCVKLKIGAIDFDRELSLFCLLYTSPSPRDCS